MPPGPYAEARAPLGRASHLGSARVGRDLTDHSAAATGHAGTDHLRIMALAEAALAFALEVLAPGGAFVAKVLQGGSERALLETMRRSFARVAHFKPPSSRSDSAELYVVATGFRGAAEPET